MMFKRALRDVAGHADGDHLVRPASGCANSICRLSTANCLKLEIAQQNIDKHTSENSEKNKILRVLLCPSVSPLWRRFYFVTPPGAFVCRIPSSGPSFPSIGPVFRFAI